MSDKVTISRTTLARLLQATRRYKTIQSFFRELISESAEPRAEDLPNGIDWAEIDLNSAMTEADAVLAKR